MEITTGVAKDAGKLLSFVSEVQYQATVMAHRFLLLVRSDQLSAIDDGLASLQESISRIPAPAIRAAVLVRTLVAIARVFRVPPGYWIQRYFDGEEHRTDVERFQVCVEGILAARPLRTRSTDRVLTVVDERLGDPQLRIEEVAQTVGVSSRRLSELFSRQVGKTFRAYLRDRRLDRASDLLVTTGRSVKEVWVAVGYNDSSDFYHDFKRRFGVPPTRYREESSIGDPRYSPFVRFDGPGRLHPPVARPLLVVDDDEGTRTTLAAYFGSCGYGVCTAANGQEGLEKAFVVRPFVVILDFRLPDMDGLAWLHRFRTKARDPTPRVILFSADWSLEDRRAEIESENAWHLSKLSTLDDIERMVERCGT